MRSPPVTTTGPALQGADLRTTVLGTTAWAGALVGLSAPRQAASALAAVLVVGLVLGAAARQVPARRAPSSGTRVGSGSGPTLAGIIVTFAALLVMAALRVEGATTSPVAGWAEQRAVAEVVLTVRSDPVVRSGPHADFVVAEATTRTVTARGRTSTTVVPLLVIGGTTWAEVPLGSVVRVTGRLTEADSPEHAAVLAGGDAPVVEHPPAAVYGGAAAVRAAVREAADGGPGHGAQLVPALVTGDDAGLSERVVEDFRTAGLTHLTAVSGTNLTLVLAFLLLLARWSGVRGRGLLVVGLLGVVGFVLMARPEPSVVRAAAMGTVALLGLGAGGRAAGVRALGAAVLLLLVYDPWLARSPGFALSVLATGGILFVAPTIRDALGRWLPRWGAEAVAVPLAAQLACTPVVAALSGEVSLVAVAANLVVAPAVGPATVLGLVGGLLTLLVPALGAVPGWLAAGCAQFIVVTAEHAARFPAAAVVWPSDPAGIAALAVVSALLAVLAPIVLARRWAAATVAVLLVVLVARPSFGGLLPSWLQGGWPPSGWVLVMCDVGQGDALVVATGPGEGVVVDAGPEPEVVDRCLDRLAVRRVPAVVLTHFHADHVGGLPGVLSGRDVGEVQVSALPEPAAGAREVRAAAEAAGVPVRAPALGEVLTAGDARWTVVGPRRIVPGHPNDASLVLIVEVRGVTVLLTGDVEPDGQRALVTGGTRLADVDVDVLKVPHHGSAYQDTSLLTGLRPRVALVSVGVGNDYGHPAPDVLTDLEEAGALLRRTDVDGDVAVVARDGELRVVGSDEP